MNAETEAWMTDALCAQVDGDAWFPSEGKGNSRDTRAAKRICAECPVFAECLDYAFRTSPQYGIWGGRTARELFREKKGWKA